MTDVVIRSGVVVRQVEGFRPQCVDLYMPADGAQAVCVYLHGGGWRVGSRRAGPGPLSPTSGRLFERMAAQGLAVASADYRLSGEARFPAQLDDVLATFRWLRDDCADVAGLPLVVFGVSAGGHLAALASLASLASLDGSVAVRAAALWYAVTDLLAMPEDLAAAGVVLEDREASREARLLGAPAADVPQLARAASPVMQVRAGAPPFLLLHGDADRAVPFSQSQRLHDALLSAHNSSTLETVAGYDHMFRAMPDADVEALVDRTCAFLLSASVQ